MLLKLPFVGFITRLSYSVFDIAIILMLFLMTFLLIMQQFYNLIIQKYFFTLNRKVSFCQ